MEWYRTHYDKPTLWSMLNKQSRMIAMRLMAVTGDAAYRAYTDKTGFHPPHNNEGVFGVNYWMSFETTGEPAQIEEDSRGSVRFRLVTDRDAKGDLQRSFVHSLIDVYNPAGSEHLVGKNETWVAFTKPFHPREERKVEVLPEVLQTMQEHPLSEEDVAADPMQTFAVPFEPEDSYEWIIPYYFHNDHTDLFQHVYTVQYLQIANDLLVQLAGREGCDVKSMRFVRTQIYFRKPFHSGVEATCRIRLHIKEGAFFGTIGMWHGDVQENDAKVSVLTSIEGTIR